LKGDSLDVAILKFCYADIERDTDESQVFEYYKETISRLKQEHPKTVFVHVTIPLTVRNAAWRRWAKTLIGREEASDITALKRNNFNDAMRKAYAAEPIFDLAAVESTFPTGGRRSFSFAGQEVYELAEEYTSDGGHLNQMGSRLAAKEFVKTLARCLRAQTE